MTSSPGIEPELVGGECFHHCANPAPDHDHCAFLKRNSKHSTGKYKLHLEIQLARLLCASVCYMFYYLTSKPILVRCGFQLFFDSRLCIVWHCLKYFALLLKLAPLFQGKSNLKSGAPFFETPSNAPGPKNYFVCIRFEF